MGTKRVIKRVSIGQTRFVAVRVPAPEQNISDVGAKFDWEIFDGQQEISVDELVSRANRLESHVCRLLRAFLPS